MIIMFSGHRNKITDNAFLENVANLYEGATWIHGGARGFDTQVSEYAKEHGIQQEVFRPDYSNGREAPILRNIAMIERADIVALCYDGRKSGGTFFVYERAKKSGKRIIRLGCHS